MFMRYHELVTEAILEPDHKMVDTMSDILDEVNMEYSNYLKQNHDIDDIDVLAELLNAKTKQAGLPIEWLVYDDERQNPDEWISAMAFSGKGGDNLSVILWNTNLEDKWGPETFKEMVLQMLSHETIHFNQYGKIGRDRLSNIQTGHQKGTKLKAKTGKERDWQRSYLRDPHELMAYGHDLSQEIKRTSDPQKALRNPEAFIDDLPVYNQFRKIFPPNAKPLQKLLSYAARYISR